MQWYNFSYIAIFILQSYYSEPIEEYLSNYCISKDSVDMVANTNYPCFSGLTEDILNFYFQKKLFTRRVF